ncbi:hypothetical protein PVL29_005415 [Vitis rotundifolia]|uniref:Fe2OG dioxygenase domain-containing protein n=1 Tax=Vitis rotundifolia TaxID=103349 RepID=A0AA39ACX9_VITRO|nr:hypothetical protein PVL29_005415 [Vitis rotundifolia]
MASRTSTVVMAPPSEEKHDVGFLVFDPKKMVKQELPKQFIWPNEDLVEAKEELNEPLVDMEGFLKGDEVATAHAAELVRQACVTHGFFQVINHGVNPDILHATEVGLDPYFNLPMSRKLSMHKKVDELCGYCGAHSDRFAAKLTWKEMLTFEYHFKGDTDSEVADYFKNVVGEDFEETGWVFQRFCEAMKDLSLKIFKLLAISLDLEDTSYCEKFFEDGFAVLRCNYYPVCPESGLTFGTGPHCDPTSLTILHQDQVGGLEVFSNEKWYYVKPQPGALVINIGDTLMALTNGIYKSCLHRAAAKNDRDRISFAYFISPRQDKLISPIKDLIAREGSKKYPDFKWEQLLDFTQVHDRTDDTTIKRFVEFLESSETK